MSSNQRKQVKNNNNNKSKNALVTLQKQGNAKKNKKKVNQVTNGVRLGYQVTRNSFLKALVSPFCPEAYGIRVPDPFPFPTVTHHLRQTTVLGANATGSGAAIFLPSPVFSLIDVGAVNGTGATVQSTPFTRFNTVGATIPYFLFKSTTVGALNAIYGTYRVVSWGIKISNLQPELSATGRITIGMVPIGDSVPSENELVNTSILASSITPVFGTPVSQLGSAGLLQLPSAQMFAVQNLLHGDLEVSGMYTNSSFWQFKTTDTQGNMYTSHTSGDSATRNTATGVIATSGYKDPNRMMGGCAIAIYFEGVPASTVNAFQIETIYHIEGSPQISTSASTTPVPSGAEKSIVGTTDVVDQAMGVASKLENVFTFIDKGADFLNRSTAAFDQIAALGTAAKLLM
ncbi:hypothetical protein 2 [Hubei tombus-like virus 33]|uniref:hypothetical protein 2 n=1 Tax=Hubei tombus-like virus 33 TaxID=1923281 RepID=UPI00090AD6F9|nr:hypothetical protein 2 [Hubei tombus-like virus 33]APG76493.1 hypothetical protein 2 [Hubei tombus-like virus 33]